VIAGDLDGAPDFEKRILPQLVAIPCWRSPTDEEIGQSFAAYQRGAEPLIECWSRVASPIRANPDGLGGAFYRRARLLPRSLNQMTFLATIRAVLAAGRHFFDHQLRPESARAIRESFSFLERRHEHVPPGWAPRFHFPRAFVEFVDGESVERAKIRFFVIAAINEVQQHVYSLHLAETLGLPDLRRHAALERAMAIQYLAAWSPPATEKLWRQCLHALDGLNAAVFATVLHEQRLAFPASALLHGLSAAREWRAFVAGLDAVAERR
jgi:hypothetical protein